MNKDKGLLHELVVLELASVLAGPSVGQFFAELGATVLKIENVKTQGDVTRRWKLPSEDAENTVSAYFSAANFGKQSIALDLSEVRVQALVYEMAAKADMVLVNFKPGDAQKLGMDYPALAALNPRLIYGSITGYGNQQSRAGYDAVLQAEAGLMFLNGEKEGSPQKMPVAMIDLLAAHQLKEGLLAALYFREKTGKGQLVEVSLLGSAISSLANQATNFLVAGVEPQRMGSEHPNIMPYGSVYKAIDGKELVLAVGDDRQFKALCEVLGEPELAQDPLYQTNRVRVANRVSLQAKLTALVGRQTRADLLEKLINRHVPAGAVHSIPEALAQPLAQPQLLFDETGAASGIKQVAFQLQGQKPAALLPPPVFGEHTGQVLTQWTDCTPAEISALAASGAITLGEK